LLSIEDCSLPLELTDHRCWTSVTGGASGVAKLSLRSLSLSSYLAYPFSSEASMSAVRTYFLWRIANGEREKVYFGQQRDRLPRDVRNAFCQNHGQKHVTSFAEWRKKCRIASRKSSFLLFKQTFSYDFALVFPSRSQLRSSARGQEKNLVFVREKEEDF
jgi:hypothetical protein